MPTCDICSAEMGLNETTAYAIDDLQELIGRGFGPPDKVVRMALSAGWSREQVVARWQQELEAHPKPYWMFCPACAKRANKYMPAAEAAAPAPAVEAAAEDAAPVQPIAARAPAVEPAVEAPPPAEEEAEPAAAAEAAEEEALPVGKRPAGRRGLWIGLLIGLLGGVVFSMLVLDRILHPVPTAPVATTAPAPTPVTAQPTRLPPTRRPATPRPTEILYPPTVIPVPNLAGVVLTLDDLPTGFREMPDSRREPLGLTAEGLAAAFDLEQGRLRELAVQDNRTSGEFVATLLVYPLTPQEQEAFDAGLTSADGGLAPLWGALAPGGWITPTRAADLYPYGEHGAWLASVGSGGSAGLVLEVLAARRGPVLEFLLLGYAEDGEPAAEELELIAALDGRLAALVPPPYVPGATARPVPVPPADLAAATVRSTDLPAGFAALSASALAELGLPTEVAMGPFFEAQIDNRVAFSSTTTAGEIVLLTWMHYPLTEMEARLAQRSLASLDPAEGAALLGLTAAQWRSPRALEGLAGLGDAAAGMSGVDTAQRPNRRLELIVFARGRALVYLMVGYVEGSDPRVDIVRVARSMDVRLKAALDGTP